MSDLVHGRHLQVESLDHESIIEIERFTAWVGSANFGPLLTDLEKCFDDAREEKIGPLLASLGLKTEVGSRTGIVIQY